MDFSAIKYFIVTAQVQHMTKAARLLNITQPALSASIRRLEDDVGCQLFDRTGRGIRLNRFGSIFLKHAIELEHLMNACLAELDEERQNVFGFVRVACSRSPTNTQVINLLLSKGITLDARIIPRNWEYELLHNNLDLVLTFGKTHLSGIESSTLCRYKVVIVAGENHPLSKAPHITAEDVSRYPFCCNSAPHSVTYMARSACEAQGVSPRITFQGRDTADMLNVIRSNQYLGLMIESHLHDTRGITILPVEHFEVFQPFYIYWRKSDDQNSFLTFIRQNIISFYQGLFL